MPVFFSPTPIWSSKKLEGKAATTAGSTTNQSSLVVPLPANDPGDLILLIGSVSGGSTGQSSVTCNTPSGWSSNYNTYGPNAPSHSFVFSKQMTGSEGSSVTLTQSSGTSSWAVVAVSMSTILGTVNVGGATSINPPNLNLTTSKPTIWITALMTRTSASLVSSVVLPTGYDEVDRVASQSSAGSIFTVVGYKQNKAASDDPAAFDKPAQFDKTITIGVR